MEDKILISSFKSVKHTSGTPLKITEFIKGIRDGKWQDAVLSVRNAKDEEEKKALKQKCDAVTVSGLFDKRSASSLRHHSGFIAMDIDNVDNPNTVKKVIEKDPYVYAAFVSVSGKGICLMFRIDGSRHEDAFSGLDEYLYKTYGLISDKSCKDVSRLRIISYDPYIYINEEATTFKKYPPKPKQQKRIDKVVFVNTDFDQIVKSIYDRGLNLCEEYGEWLRVCYALVSQYGDSNTARSHFDTLSRTSSKYNEKDCLKQYDVCLKNHRDSKKKQSTINHIYYLAKQNGIETYSVETKDVIRAASSQSKNGISKADIAKGLEKFNQIPEDYSSPIIDQVISQGIDHQTENIIDDIIHFLQPYGLRKNLITRNVEMNGKPLDDSDINTLFVECKSMFDKATKDLVCSVIFSNKIDQYNPIKEFFESDTTIHPDLPNLKILLSSIKTDTKGYEKWITKWLVSIVASAYGNYSPLVLVFSGRVQGTGKTHFMRYLLPKSMRYLFAESDMDNGKDDEILMTKKLIILDDEYGGKSKREEKKLKKITSKEFINVREPYGRVSVDLRRLAVFCGTTNEDQIISDHTGNRRVLPINIISIDQAAYNKCDKIQLWHELYHLYKSGYDYTVLKEDIQELYDNTEQFTMSTPEEDLVAEKLSKGSLNVGEWMNITGIINYLTIDNNQRLSNTRLGMVLSKFGYEKKRMKMNGTVVTAYHVNKVDKNMSLDAKNEDFPF